MSAEVEIVPPVASVSPSRAARWWRAVDRAMEFTGDRLNPILVKETRQALKSKYFTITFGLLLLCGWGWSILGVAMMGQDAWRGTQGDDMFVGYYFVLVFPLLVIVPFGAFRSLATEQEDRTYELMSITTLGPRQIIRGKLGSAVLQMVVYLSAVTPCLAFTYLLRGIDFPTILFVLSYTVLTSLGLAMIGLFAGTLTSEKHWQVVLSVALIAGLFLALWTCIAFTMEVALRWSAGLFMDWEFWMGYAGFLTAFAAYFVLVFYAAAARITFASDNRSTRLRVTMLVHQVLFVGWMAWVWISPHAAARDPSVILAFMMLAGLHWYAMGAFMTGESSELSTRVKRQLPQSFLGRVFLTWFNPGPGTGYVFAICNLLGVLAIGMTALAARNAFGASPANRWSARYFDTLLPFGVLGCSYIVIYLGVGLMLVRLLRKFTFVGMMLSVLLQILLLLLGAGLPTIVHMMSAELRGQAYCLVHVTNPIWTLGYLIDRPTAWANTRYYDVLLAVVPAAAVIVFLLNLPAVAREVRHVRIARPKRVAEEDAQLSAAKRPPKPVKTSPWD